MTEQQWKPGTVAVVKAHLGQRETRVARGFDGRWHGEQGSYVRVSDVRPLVVIDPTDEQDVKRLADAFCLARWDHVSSDTECDPLTFSSMQAALREFANPTPPKPERPGGWGAVVEDDTGAYWTLYAPEADVWINHREGKRRWHEIASVRVVGEGVQP